MVDVAQLLSTLHPMREPPQPAAVLPYLLTTAMGVAVAAAFALAALRLHGGHGRLRAAAQRSLAASRHLQPAERFSAQAILLRRLVRGDTVGPAWLTALDHAFATTFFSQGAGRAFGDPLYHRRPAIDLDGIDQALVRLIARMSFAEPDGAGANGGTERRMIAARERG